MFLNGLPSIFGQMHMSSHVSSTFQVKSELLCKSQANEYLTIRDIAYANRKVKIEIDNFKGPPGKKHKVSYVTYTAEERASIGEGIPLCILVLHKKVW